MSDDWKVGDLALCVNRGGWVNGDGSPTTGLPYGFTGAVRRVWQQRQFTMLVFDVGNRHGYSSKQFRKIRPDEHEDCEPEFVTLLNNCKPVKVQA